MFIYLPCVVCGLSARPPDPHSVVQETGIAWGYDKTHLYGKYLPTNYNTDPRFRGGNTSSGPINEDEHLMVWMKPAAKPSFRKLWAIIHTPILAGALSATCAHDAQDAAPVLCPRGLDGVAEARGLAAVANEEESMYKQVMGSSPCDLPYREPASTWCTYAIEHCEDSKVLYLGTAGSTVRIHVENRFNTYDFGGAKVRIGLVHMCCIWFLHGTPAWLVFWSDTLLACQYAVHHSTWDAVRRTLRAMSVSGLGVMQSGIRVGIVYDLF